MAHFDTILVGGGLQSGLLALALLEGRPGISLLMLEREAQLGGNHTWSFNHGDLSEQARRWVSPLIVKSWRESEVRFPGLRRVLPFGYSAVTSERFDEVLRAALSGAPGAELVTGAEVTSIEADRVELADGRSFGAELVIDARGPERPPPEIGMAFQKFVGLDVVVEGPPLDLDRALLMDATVEQLDGFRFFYLLPWGEGRLLAEETFFSPTPLLDREAGRRRTLDSLESRGFKVLEVEREEQGVLPMPWDRWHRAPELTGPLVAGYRGGYFHPGTGYSFGQAAKLAEAVAAAGPGREAALRAAKARFDEHEAQARYSRVLNRMVYRGWRPEDWWRIYQWFHRLPDDLIRRFYALELTNLDRARILMGVPPRGMSLRAMMAKVG